MPAHGQSAEKRANLLTMSRHLQAVLDQLAPTEPFSVVAHSFGSMVSAFTLSKQRYNINQLVYLTAPSTLPAVFNEYKEMARLSTRVYNGLVSTAEGLLGESLDGVTTEAKTAAIDYNKLTLIHDRNDKILPFSNSEAMANGLDRAELHAITNTGHYRMLWDEGVIQLVAGTLAEAQKPAAIPS